MTINTLSQNQRQKDRKHWKWIHVINICICNVTNTVDMLLLYVINKSYGYLNQTFTPIWTVAIVSYYVTGQDNYIGGGINKIWSIILYFFVQVSLTKWTLFEVDLRMYRLKCSWQKTKTRMRVWIILWIMKLFLSSNHADWRRNISKYKFQ